MGEPRYAGFWIRLGAAIVDTIILLVLTLPILFFVYGGDYWTSDKLLHGALDLLLSYIFPIVAVVLFWIYKSATPGKMLTGTRIVDAKTGGRLGVGQCLVRYVGYFLASLPLFLGIFWIAFDKRKQGLHDKLAGTLVVYEEDEF